MTDADETGRVMTDEEHARALREQLKSLHAFDLVWEMMVSLISFGYQKLGLTGETLELRDLGDAHFAIEALGALLKVVDREQGGAQTRDLHSTLAQMQLGYVQALELAGERPPEPEAEERRAAPAAEAPPAEPHAAPAADEPEAKAPAERAGTAEAGSGGPEVETAAEEPEAETAADRPAATKPAGKKAAAKKPAAKKPAARKPAAKKAPVKKPPADAAG